MLVLDVFKEEQRHPRIFSSQLYLQKQDSEIDDEFEDEDDRENFGSLRFSGLRIGIRRGSDRSATLPKERPSENYGNEEHTTVAAFLPWRGL